MSLAVIWGSNLAYRDRENSLAKLSKYVARAHRMEGWDFHEVQMEPAGPGPSWDYTARARELVAGARAVLDMGTGGGEVFTTISEGYSGFAVATDAWPPNLAVAARQLSPRGAAVVNASGSYLPFASESFDIVLNSYEELSPPDAARVLRPGGRLLIQQIGHNEWQKIVGFFPKTSREGRPDQFHTYSGRIHGRWSDGWLRPFTRHSLRLPQSGRCRLDGHRSNAPVEGPRVCPGAGSRRSPGS